MCMHCSPQYTLYIYINRGKSDTMFKIPNNKSTTSWVTILFSVCKVYWNSSHPACYHMGQGCHISCIISDAAASWGVSFFFSLTSEDTSAAEWENRLCSVSAWFRLCVCLNITNNLLFSCANVFRPVYFSVTFQHSLDLILSTASTRLLVVLILPHCRHS